MTTQNPRVAGYIPTDLHDRFKSFKEERGIKGDSQALALMIAEFFGVSHQVAQKVDYSSFVTQNQFQEVISRISELSSAIEDGKSPGSIISKLPDKLRRLEERIDSLEMMNGKSIVKETASPMYDAVPGQMDLLGLGEVVQSEDSPESSSLSESFSNPVNGLKPMNGYALSKRFGLHDQVVGNNKNNWKSAPEKFTEWTKKKDPDGVAWRYDQKDKLYHPITSELSVA